MQAKTEAQLNSTNAQLLQRIRIAKQAQNYDYAIALYQNILATEPEFIEGRRELRALCIAKYKTLSPLTRQMNSVKVSALLVKAAAEAKRNPKEALKTLEEALALEPHNQRANSLLAEIGIQEGLKEMTALAYETLRDAKPNDTDNLYKLALTYKDLGELEKARMTLERLVQIDPTNGEALSLLKNVTASITSKSGGWEQAQDYRSLIKDQEQAALLEQASKVVKSEEAILEQINTLYARLQAEPNNIPIAKQIAQLCRQRGDLTTALEWYRYAYELSGRADPVIEKAISDIELEMIDEQLKTLSGEQSAEREALLQRKAQLHLEQCRQRVAKYPNDNQFRFELGEALYRAGQYREALRELQLGMRQPSVRLRAMNLIGQAYHHLGMNDLAVKQLQTAADEIPIMDDLKKEILYNLAQVLFSLGQKDAAIERLKLIYEVDMSYRDVADLVEKSYQHS
ncbi:MAG: tetratricopeptide repeat protein [Verrucomicrobiae bacterium]|nr:tetratricopeptide repeat protein [Verrucomicrobiae bacterium]